MSSCPALALLRAHLARAAFGLPCEARLPPPALGPLTLRPHQRVAVARLRGHLALHGGALLADDVGLGKTLVALALLRDARAPLVVAPAAVRPVWLQAMRASGVTVPLLSLEALGRRAFRAPHPPPDLLVVDEAHHARAPDTRRWQALAALAAHGRVLLLSATPIHNAPRDLAALTALFLGHRAHALPPAHLARHVVRRRAGDLAPATCGERRPAIHPTRWHPIPPDPATLDALTRLPPPVAPRDGTPADSLHVHTLVRLWTSSDGALRAALRRRLARATALEHALADGRHLDRRTLRAWCADPAADAVQPDLPLGAPPEPPASLPDAAALATHVVAVRALLARLPTPSHPGPRDGARVALLRQLRTLHPGARIVAFTQFADTGRTLFRQLAPDGGVALLTAGGGRIASGPITRRDLLARFAPCAAGVPPPRAAERVELLIATDCLSEGLDLRDASVVVHLDLPWTPARLAQRVGRCARPGAPHPAVHVHALRPGPDEARWLELPRILRTKARTARHTLAPHRGASARLVRHLERWLLAAEDGAAGAAPASRTLGVVTARPGARPGDALVALRDPHGATRLVAVCDGRVRTTAGALARAVRWLDAARMVAPPTDVARTGVRRALRRWCRARRAADALHLAGGRPDPLATSAAACSPSPVLRAALARLDAWVRAAPAHRRAAFVVEAAVLRERLLRPLAAGTERALAAALAAAPDGDTWPEALRTVLPSEDAVPRAPGSAPRSVGGSGRWRVLALAVVSA